VFGVDRWRGGVAANRRDACRRLALDWRSDSQHRGNFLPVTVAAGGGDG